MSDTTDDRNVVDDIFGVNRFVRHLWFPFQQVLHPGKRKHTAQVDKRGSECHRSAAMFPRLCIRFRDEDAAGDAPLRAVRFASGFEGTLGIEFPLPLHLVGRCHVDADWNEPPLPALW